MSRHDGYDERFSELSLLSYQVAFRLSGDRAESEDVAQEAMTRAYLRWGRISDYAEAWIVRVSTNLVIGGWRRRGSRRSDHQPPDTTTTDADAGERLALVAALRRLPKRQREVAVLRYLGDLSVEHTAAALGLSESAVKAHSARSLVALRRELSPDSTPPSPSTSSDVHDPTGVTAPAAVRDTALQPRGER